MITSYLFQVKASQTLLLLSPWFLFVLQGRWTVAVASLEAVQKTMHRHEKPL